MTRVQAASLFFAYLTVVSNLAVLAVVAATVAARLSPTMAGTLGRLREDAGSTLLWLAWLVAATATAGSLWFSEVGGLVPCQLCWFQRIGMYPLTVILLVAAVRRDPAVWRYVVPVALAAMAVSGYHYAIEWFPTLDAGACDATAPCTFVWFRRFGWISLPYMAFSAFAFIVAATLLGRTGPRTKEVAP